MPRRAGESRGDRFREYQPSVLEAHDVREPGVDLASGLSTFAEFWRQDFRRYWGIEATEPAPHLEPMDRIYLGFVAQVAHDFAKTAQTLDRNDFEFKALVDHFRNTLDLDVREDEFLLQCLEVELGRTLAEELYDMPRRTVELMEFLVSIPSDRVRAYLHRVAECYIRGMNTEGVVMCRAVLREYVPDDRLRVGEGNGAPIAIAERLKYLKHQRLLPRAAIDAGHRVKHAGNDAVHNVPGSADLPTVLEDLAQVLRALEHLANPTRPS